jgi:peptidoglycan/xylan/chitin deacetylase (PgdA/CDA1 family)
MYFHKTPWWLKALYPQLIWEKEQNSNSIYLTFDDGPVPGVTEFVLEVLSSFQAKATFFSVGENIIRNSLIFYRILEEGHSVGNHTQSHLNGWKINDDDYLADIAKCEKLLDQYIGIKRTRLFRPPYGRIQRSQINKLNNYQIIMWNVLSGDFDNKLDPELSCNKIIKSIKPGSIVVFHDSLRAKKNIQYLLPKVMESVGQRNFTFNPLN